MSCLLCNGRDNAPHTELHAQLCDNVDLSHVALRRTVLIAALLAGGCNQVFSLGETAVVDAAPDAVIVDRDEDGVLDVVDVCPDAANPLQEDQDGDRIGDACDVCITGSNHNEDGDTLLDGCDNCPQTANDDQANADGDALGDVCDFNPGTVEIRNRFDGFGELTIDWIPGTVEWQTAGDALSPVAKPSVSDLGIWNRRIEVRGRFWSIATRVRVITPVDGESVGLWTRTNVASGEYQCYVEYTADSDEWKLRSGAALGLFFKQPDNVITLRVYLASDGLHCSANGIDMNVTESDPMSLPTTQRTHPGLFTTMQDVAFDYIDAVSTLD